MANFFWVLGFDFNAIQNTDNTYTLAMGLVEVLSVNPNSPVLIETGNPLNLRVDDTVRVHVFNITTGATTEGYTVTSVELNFTKADVGQVGSPYPFTPTAIECSGGNPAVPTFTVDPLVDAVCGVIQIPSLGPSASESGSFIFQAQPEWPRWEVIISAMTLSVIGSFNLSISMVVQGPDAGGEPTVPRTFSSDPEMIVEAPPPPEPWDSERPTIKR